MLGLRAPFCTTPSGRACRGACAPVPWLPPLAQAGRGAPRRGDHPSPGSSPNAGLARQPPGGSAACWRNAGSHPGFAPWEGSAPRHAPCASAGPKRGPAGFNGAPAPCCAPARSLLTNLGGFPAVRSRVASASCRPLATCRPLSGRPACMAAELEGSLCSAASWPGMACSSHCEGRSGTMLWHYLSPGFADVTEQTAGSGGFAATALATSAQTRWRTAHSPCMLLVEVRAFDSLGNGSGAPASRACRQAPARRRGLPGSPCPGSTATPAAAQIRFRFRFTLGLGLAAAKVPTVTKTFASGSAQLPAATPHAARKHEVLVRHLCYQLPVLKPLP